MYITFFIIFLALFLYKLCVYRRVEKFLFLFLFFIIFIVNIIYFISNYFTKNGINDTTVYYLQYGLLNGFKTVGVMEYWWIPVFMFLMLICVYFLFTFQVTQRKERGVFLKVAPFMFLVSSIYFLRLSSVYSVINTNQEINDGFFESYKYPYIQQVGTKRNFIYIYTESLEQTYSDENLFPGLTPELNKLSKEAVIFTNLQQIPGAGFTMGGMVASQCGISLLGIPYANSMSGMDSYLPVATCLGDLLHRNGYYLSYAGGSNQNFAGKNMFYSTHSFDEIFGAENLLDNSNYKSNWGLYDDTLFEKAYKIFTDLSKAHKNFGLFLLTLDTHQPNEKFSKSCNNYKYKDGLNNTLNAVHCSDRLVAEFVHKIRNSKEGKDLVIVIASDHLAPKDPRVHSYAHSERSNRFMILSPGVVSSKVDQIGSTLDTGVTFLPFIGYEGNIGLGRNLLSDTYSDYEVKIIQWKIKEWVSDFRLFWNFPTIKKSITVHPNEKYLLIDDRKFKIPALVEIDKNMQTQLRFEFDLEFSTNKNKNQWTLLTMANKIANNKNFLLVDYCKNLKEIKIINSDLCLVRHGANGSSITSLLGDVVTISMNEIKNF